MFLFSDHLGMTKDAGFVDNILYLLLEDPRPEDAERTAPSEVPLDLGNSLVLDHLTPSLVDS